MAFVFLWWMMSLMVHSVDIPPPAAAINTPEQQTAARHAAAEKLAAQARAETQRKAEGFAWRLCSSAIRTAAKYPSSVDVSVLSSPGTQSMAGGGYIVRLAFEAKNGFGNLIPQMARCEVKGGKLTHFSVNNR
ncbi:hypothetical protein [Mariprofundus ferrooxydans]|uniref:hypothetical protein n=1 Tax=Mariprofundus ferrooxydans TaxID=314344 RepID=UPI0014318F9B|nr:hypothetical protein [Mariprofundus ferrooxydans]